MCLVKLVNWEQVVEWAVKWQLQVGPSAEAPMLAKCPQVEPGNLQTSWLQTAARCPRPGNTHLMRPDSRMAGCSSCTLGPALQCLVRHGAAAGRKLLSCLHGSTGTRRGHLIHPANQRRQHQHAS